MGSDDIRDRFWDAALDDSGVDVEPFLAEGGKGIRAAVDVHQLLIRTAQTWRQRTRPQKLGRFEVQGDLGEGGQSRVYLGWDPELLRAVAIKVIASDRWAINEARAIAQLDHRSVVKVFDVGPDRLVMELLEGGSLREHIEAMANGEHAFLSTTRARLHCLARIAEGLTYCHERGILHRDIKPGNVLFARNDDHPRLVDFGLAHLDSLESLDITQNLVGTPAYLAPEQVESGETGTDPRSDIFSFGVLAYEILTLECPFRRSTRTATLDAVSLARPSLPKLLSRSVSRSARHLVQHCLELDPRDRYQNMSEVTSDLQNVLANRPISAGGQSLTHRAKLLYRRNKRVTTFASVGVALTFLISMLLWAQSLREERAEFAAGLQRIEDGLPELRKAMDFTDTGLKLGEALVRAKVYDDQVLTSAVLGNTGEAVQDLVESWSHLLGEVVTEIEADKQGGRRTDAWKSAFQIDEHLLPDKQWNRSFRNRGRIVRDSGLEDREGFVLLRQKYRGIGMLTGWVDFREVPFEDYPSSGYYRAKLPGIWERDFLVHSIWQEEVFLALTPHRLPTAEWFELPGSGAVASDLITYGQYREFCTLAGFEDGSSPAAEDTDPFTGTWNMMLGYATWAGGRLPSAEEVCELLSAHGQPDNQLIGGEAVSDCFQLDTLDVAWFVVHSSVLTGAGQPPITWAADGPRDNLYQMDDKCFGFRILYPAPVK